MEKSKKLISVVILLCGILIGLVISARLDLNPSAKSESTATSKVALIETDNFTDAVQKVASAIGPTVVSIKTENTRHYRIQQQPFSRGPSHDEFFDRFFEDFFGEIPEFDQRQFGLGSGVIIDEAGYILTNEHVINNSEKITVTLSDGRQFKGTLKGTDPRSDLAVIKIEAANLPVASLGDSSSLKIGQWVVAIGNPFGQLIPNPEPTVTAGVVSALHRSLPQASRRDTNYTDLIQTDAAINPGNSGGPLVNLKGQIVGINVALFSTTGGYQGIGFAIPVNTAKRIIESLIKGKQIDYGWIGVSVQNLNQQLADYFKLPNTDGALVTHVLENSPAQKAGLKDSDLITAIDGQAIKQVPDLLNVIGSKPVGQKVSIKISRDGKAMEFPVEVGKRPSFDETGKVVQESEKEADIDATGKWRGLSVQSIPETLSKRMGLSDNAGVIISDIEKNSPAEETGLQKGDVITAVNRNGVKNVDGFKAAIKDINGDCLLRTNRGYVVIKKKSP